MSRRRVGLGCSGRCAPAWTLPFGFAFPSPLTLCPRLGGVDELRGVFAGSFSFSRSAALSACNSVFDASSTSKRASNVHDQIVFLGSGETLKIGCRSHRSLESPLDSRVNSDALLRSRPSSAASSYCPPPHAQTGREQLQKFEAADDGRLRRRA